MKVAQYEVLGGRSKKTTRPERDDRRLFDAGEAAYERTRSQHIFYRPLRDATTF
jgi:hypothetical protein